MLLSIVFLPLLGYIGASLFGRLLGKGACYLAVLNIFLAFIFSCYFLQKIIYLGSSYKLVLAPWIYSDLYQINWGFLVDGLTASMLFIVTLISTLVHFYSLEYMENDPHIIKFMSYLSLFTFFMLMLITADNFIHMFVGWEGVGLASFLLISFWNTRIQANKAAIKAMVMNRIGDFAILLAIFFIHYVFNTLDYDILFNLIGQYSEAKFKFFDLWISYVDIISLLLFLGAMGKSAQLGLHTWLPDAMEGPTPVSALLHAATMVTAGVFLIIRCSFLFELSSLTLNVILVIGSLTTFFSSTVGLFQNDIKKIIAYSTCSQLGYMIFACGLSCYDVAFFHLSNHAFFKALLFLSAGAVIHAVNDEQDIRQLGGLRSKLPFTYSVMLIGSFALMGFPFLSGFFSKDAILELAYSKYDTFGHFAYYLGTFSVFSTSFYSIRLLYLVFLAEPNGTRESLFTAHEPGIKMLLPLFILCFFSIFVGYLTKDLFIGFGTSFWNNIIFVLPSQYLMCDIEFLSILPKLMPLFLSILGATCAFFLYSHGIKTFFNLKFIAAFRLFYTFLNRRWFIDRVYNQYIAQPIFNSGYSFYYTQVDRGFLEHFGPYGFSSFVLKSSQQVRSLQNGTLFFFLFLLMLLLILFLIIFLNIYKFYLMILGFFGVFCVFSFFLA
jgi:proton-translocating NADH-quinone oxidoreductase chain L